jgi:ABC-type transport system involved in multi-copper enzyme maturation permease subunit
MRQIALIAGKELRDGLRNRWVLAVTLLLALFALTLSFLGAAPTGSVKVSPLAVTIVSLSSLSIFLLPMIALLLSYDAIIGEWERGTLGLLLAYPVARWQVMLGKVRRPCRHSRDCDRAWLRHGLLRQRHMARTARSAKPSVEWSIKGPK